MPTNTSALTLCGSFKIFHISLFKTSTILLIYLWTMLFTKLNIFLILKYLPPTSPFLPLMTPSSAHFLKTIDLWQSFPNLPFYQMSMASLRCSPKLSIATLAETQHFCTILNLGHFPGAWPVNSKPLSPRRLS